MGNGVSFSCVTDSFGRPVIVSSWVLNTVKHHQLRNCESSGLVVILGLVLYAGPSKIMFTRAFSFPGTASSWHFSVKDPLKLYFILNISRLTISAAFARITASDSTC